MGNSWKSNIVFIRVVETVSKKGSASWQGNSHSNHPILCFDSNTHLSRIFLQVLTHTVVNFTEDGTCSDSETSNYKWRQGKSWTTLRSSVCRNYKRVNFFADIPLGSLTDMQGTIDGA